MQHQLRKIDISGSGAVSKSEFEAVLVKCSVLLSKKDVDALFATHAHSGREQFQTSIKLNEQYLNIDSFVSGLRDHASSSAVDYLIKGSQGIDHPRRKTDHEKLIQQKKHNFEVQTAESSSMLNSTIGIKRDNSENTVLTELEKEHKRIVRKVFESNSDPGSARYRTQFIYDVALAGGKVRAHDLLDHLNRTGSKLSEPEFNHLVSKMNIDDQGNLEFARFTDMISQESHEMHNNGDLGRLGIGISNQNQRRHDHFKEGNSPKKTAAAVGSGGRPDLGSTQHSLIAFERGNARDDIDRREVNKNRLNWCKVVEHVRSNKENLEKVVKSQELKVPLSTTELGRVLASAGIRLGASDVKLLESHCKGVNRTTSGNSTDGLITIEAVCNSIGIKTKSNDREQPGNIISFKFKSHV